MACAGKIGNRINDISGIVCNETFAIGRTEEAVACAEIAADVAVVAEDTDFGVRGQRFIGNVGFLLYCVIDVGFAVAKIDIAGDFAFADADGLR